MSHLRSLFTFAALGLALGACSSGGDDAATAGGDKSAEPVKTAPPPKRAPLEITWDGALVVVKGDAPPKLGDDIQRAIRELDSEKCGVERSEITVTVARAGSLPSPPLPISDITELICGSKSLDISFEWDALTVEGLVTFRNLLVFDELNPKYQNRDVDGWAYVLGLSADRNVIPPGYGLVLVLPLEQVRDKRWTIEPVVDGAPVEGAIGAGWVGLLKPGIYKASNGDHFGVRDGFETRFVPDNPAALSFGGRRFPLDDDVPVFAGAVALGPDSMDPDSIDSCKLEDQKEERCGFRSAKLSGPLAVVDMGGVRAVVNQVVIHFDGTPDAVMGRRVLRSRALSEHLAIDFDGTVFQALDLSLNGYHALAGNDQSVDISFNNIAQNLVREPNAKMYKESHPRIEEMRRHPRPRSPVAVIHGYRCQSYGYTEAQWRSGLSVSRLLLRLFPAIEPAYPEDPEGGHIRVALEDPGAFRGFLGHSAWEVQRWDPGPGFDWERLATAFAPRSRPE